MDGQITMFNPSTGQQEGNITGRNDLGAGRADADKITAKKNLQAKQVYLEDFHRIVIVIEFEIADQDQACGGNMCIIYAGDAQIDNTRCFFSGHLPASATVRMESVSQRVVRVKMSASTALMMNS